MTTRQKRRDRSTVPAMSASNRTQDKAAPQSGVENKSLEPTVEDKSLAVVASENKAAKEPEGVKVVLSHYVSAGYIDEDEHGPGDEVFVTAQVAHNLALAGVAKAV